MFIDLFIQIKFNNIISFITDMIYKINKWIKREKNILIKKLSVTKNTIYNIIIFIILTELSECKILPPPLIKTHTIKYKISSRSELVYTILPPFSLQQIM